VTPPADPHYQLVRLANGAFSVRSLSEQETFHPVIGPAAEAEVLYVRQLRLRERLAAHRGEFVIWDVGLGAAANVSAVFGGTRDLPCSLRVLSFDRTLEPLRFALHHAAELDYLEPIREAAGELVTHQKTAFARGPQQVSWELHLGDFPQLLPASHWPAPHAILFDPFSPAKNPAMWSGQLFRELASRLNPARPCAMPTYSRSTMLRVSLLMAGFYVGVGHATGEKEETTIAANTLDLIDEPLKPDWLQRARRSKSAEPLSEAVYRQAPLSEESWGKLQEHPQFRIWSAPRMD